MLSVYLICCGSAYKIGIARNVDIRLNDLQVGCPNKLQLMASRPFKDAVWQEERLHVKFDKYRIRGEWFALPDQELTDLLVYLNPGTRATAFN